jgi:hypothetical protein
MHNFIGYSDVKHIMTSPIKTASTDNIPARSIRLDEILAIMSVSTFQIDAILYIQGSVLIKKTWASQYATNCILIFKH